MSEEFLGESGEPPSKHIMDATDDNQSDNRNISKSVGCLSWILLRGRKLLGIHHSIDTFYYLGRYK